MSDTKFVHDLTFNFGTAIPCQVLSFLLHRRTAEVTIGDIITELACEPTNTTILPSLSHGKYFSSRPLVEFLDSLSKPIMGQIYRDGNVYPEVRGDKTERAKELVKAILAR